MKAFESLYKAYAGKVFNYINSFIYDPDLAKDITQNTFLQLWEVRSQLDPNGNIEGYIYSISRNLLFREIRRLNILRNYTDRIKEEIKEAEEPQIEENLSRDMIEQQILSFTKGINIHIHSPLTCKLTKLEDSIPVSYKGVELKSFNAEFQANIILPDFIGLGKSSSINNGTINHIK